MQSITFYKNKIMKASEKKLRNKVAEKLKKELEEGNFKPENNNNSKTSSENKK